MTKSPAVDAYIEKSAEFARPILIHLRALVHRGCPTAVETMKWSFPHFEHGGQILCSMAAFKAHCAFGFWHQGMEKFVDARLAKTEAMGTFGRIAQREDLPGDAAMLRYIKAAVALIDSGVPARGRNTGKRKPEAKVPPDLAAALKKNKAAAATFEQFSPSHRREYVDWIVEAKREETRQKRLATALEWLAQGKSRHWKYRNC